MFNNKNNNTKAAVLFYKSATASSRSRLDRTEQSNDMTPARPTIAFHRVTATDTTLHVPLLPSLSANKKFVIWCISSKDSVSRWVRQNYPIRDVYRQQRTRPPPFTPVSSWCLWNWNLSDYCIAPRRVIWIGHFRSGSAYQLLWSAMKSLPDELYLVLETIYA